LKQITGSGKEKAATVVQNSEGGAKRGWKPATKESSEHARRNRTGRPAWRGSGSGSSSGSGFPRLGASKGRETPGEEERETPERRHRRGVRREREWPEARSSRASARPGAVFKAEGKPTAGGSAKDARAQAERLERGEGGVSKPNERLRRAVKR
jgi:hypothetical protein